MTGEERNQLLAKIEILEAENTELKEGRERLKVLETGYHSLERASTTWRTEYSAARRRVEKLEKEAAEHTRWVMLNAVDKDRLGKLQKLADALDGALKAGLIDRMACSGLVSKLEDVRGKQDASQNRSGQASGAGQQGKAP